MIYFMICLETNFGLFIDNFVGRVARASSSRVALKLSYLPYKNV